MKEIVPTPPAIVQSQFAEVRELFNRYVVPSYGRFEIAFSHGAGNHLWDVNGKRYFDFGGGIAVTSLGHGNPEITEALVEQSKKLVHVSNLYFHEPQGRLAENIVTNLAPGKVFFSNSGAEANEGLYKVARKFGHDEGRFEIITANNSFHGRTLAGIAATGQEKVKKGFEPLMPGFRHVPFNDLDAMRAAISPATVAILIEGIQGEGGITPSTVEYLLGLRKLCDEKRLLLMMDAVQCGHFRSGRFQSFQRILEGHPAEKVFLPDAVSMAKSLGGGFPIGAFWVRQEVHGVKLCDILSPGTHATTFGGTPLGCAVANKIFEVIKRDRLADNVRTTGEFLKQRITGLAEKYPGVVKGARGMGFMLGIELQEKDGIKPFAPIDQPAAAQMCARLHEVGVLLIPSGNQIVRLLPALNLSQADAEAGLDLIEGVVRRLA